MDYTKTLLIRVKCPYCSKTHTHGGGFPEDPLSFPMWRTSRCGRGEYQITAGKKLMSLALPVGGPAPQNEYR